MATQKAVNGNAFAAAKGARGNAPSSSHLSDSRMIWLDRIHILFLLYSGAHNSINAWTRAENPLFFIFVFVGILSVEIMLYAVYKYWKEGILVGKMIQVGKLAGLAAFFYATAGILAQSQGGAGEFVSVYYKWILPSSAPAMFLFAFLIQSSDPVMEAERDANAYDQLLKVEMKRDTLDRRRMKLDEQKDHRKLAKHIFKQRLLALWKESNSRRVRTTLKHSVKKEMPKLLQSAGVVLSKDKQKTSFWKGYNVESGKKSSGTVSLN